MTSSGILQPDGSRCYSGPTCKRHGQFNSSVMKSVEDYLAKNAGSQEEFIRSVLAAHDKEKEFLATHGLSEAEWEELSQGPSQFSDNSFYTGVSYDYDSYSTPYHLRNEDFNDMNRYQVYEGLRVREEDLDAEEIAKNLFDPKTPNAMKAAVAFIKKAKLDEEDAYEVTTENGYYGEEADISLTDESKKSIEDFYYSFSNATDSSGALKFVRDSGLETKGLTPVKAVELYVQENGNKKFKVPEGYTVSASSFSASQVNVNAAKVKRAKASENPPRPRVDVAGVIMSTGGNTRPSVVTGFDNYKYMSNTIPTGKRVWLHISPEKKGY